MTISGVDVSSFQGSPGQWAKTAGAIDFAAVKITELEPGGTRFTDPDAAADWQSLKASGKGRIAYLFGHPFVGPAATADFFASTLTACGGIEDGDAIAVDLEVNDGLSPARVASWAQAVMADLHARYDRLPLLYTFIDFAQAGNCAGLGSYPLWISDPNHPAGHPEVPGPWKAWHLHQYGITGAIDRDVANYPTAAAMSADLGKPKPKPAPPPKPAPSTEDDMPSGTLLTDQPTPIRLCDGQAVSQLLLSVADGAAEQKLTVSVHDTAGTYTAPVTVSWATPGVLKFRHADKVKAVSVTAPAGGVAVSYLVA